MSVCTGTPVDLSVIVKIEKLFAQAKDSGATIHERESFERKALALMAKHRLEMAEIGGHLAADDKLDDYELDVTLRVGGNARMIINIIDVIVAAFDSKLYWRDTSIARGGGWIKGGREHRLHVIGWKSDFDLINVLASRIVEHVAFELAMVKGSDAAETRSDRRGFLYGYRQTLRARCEEVFGEAIDELPDESRHTMEIVLVDRKKQVNEAFSKLRLRSAGALKGGYSDRGVAKGSDAATRADLGTSRNTLSGPRKELCS